MHWLKQSTAVTVKMGPFLDEDDGKTAETGLTLTQADFRLSKNGGDFAQKNSATAATHDELGYYDVPLNTTDTNTLGRLRIAVHEAGALPVWQDFMVLPANVYDSFVGGSDYLDVSLVQWLGTAPLALTSQRVNSNVGAMSANVITASAINADAITVDKMAPGCIVKGDQLTGLNDLSAAQVNAEADQALSDYDPPTKAELDTAESNIRGADSDTIKTISDQIDGLNDYDPAIDQVIVATNNDKTGYALSASGVQAIWDALTSALTTVGSIGKKLADWILTSNRVEIAGTKNTLDDLNDFDNGSDQVIVATNNDKTGYSISGTKNTLDDLNDLSAAQANAEADQALSDYDPPTKAELDSGLAGLNDPTVAEIADGVWDEDITTHTDPDSAGEALQDAGGAGTPPTVEEIRTEMDANSTQLAAIVADTNELQTDDVPGLITNLLSKLLKYVQLLGRSDAAIATDNATELTEINADGGSGGGDYDNATDSQEAIAGAGGGGGPTVEQIRTEMDNNSTKLASIVEDTNEIQGKLPTNNIMGSSVKTDKDDEIDAIKAKTDNLPADPASESNANKNLLLETTIATKININNFTLTDGSNVSGVYAHMLIVFYDVTNNNYPEIGRITAYDGATKKITLIYDHVNVAVGDIVRIFAVDDIDKIRVQMENVLASYGPPTKVEMDAKINSLNNLSAAQVNAEVDTALADYDAPTKSELDSAQSAIQTDIGNLNNISPSEVNAELKDVLETDTHAEPNSVPTATSSLKDKIGWLFALARNKITQTSALQTLRNNNDDGNIATSALSTDATTVTRGKWS